MQFDLLKSCLDKTPRTTAIDMVMCLQSLSLETIQSWSDADRQVLLGDIAKFIATSPLGLLSLENIRHNQDYLNSIYSITTDKSASSKKIT